MPVAGEREGVPPLVVGQDEQDVRALGGRGEGKDGEGERQQEALHGQKGFVDRTIGIVNRFDKRRSEEHTSELQSH